MMKKVQSFTKYLADKYGGKWKYEINLGWYCDDNIRYVWNVASLDYDGFEDCYTRKCMYFTDDRIPEWI